MVALKFEIDDNGRPDISGGGRAYSDLRAMIRLDIGTNRHNCLDYLSSVAEVESGKTEEAFHDGEVYETVIERDGVSVKHKFIPNKSSELSLEDFKGVIEDYWRFLLQLRSGSHVVREFRPDLPETAAGLVAWEDYWKKPHPYRGLIEGIPAQGPRAWVRGVASILVRGGSVLPVSGNLGSWRASSS